MGALDLDLAGAISVLEMCKEVTLVEVIAALQVIELDRVGMLLSKRIL